jgi:hypothetical protein
VTRCPSDLRLESYLLDDELPGVGAHVDSCSVCHARLSEMRRIGDEFRAEVYPATVDRVVGAARRWRLFFRSLFYLAPIPVAAAAAAVLLVATPHEPPGDYRGIKGSPLAMTVFAQTMEGTRALSDGSAVSPEAALRFHVKVSAPCRLWVVSVDESAQVSRLYPPSGEGGASISAAGPLPGGAVLDGRPGPERIFAVCANDPLTFADIERAARKAASGGATAVRVARGLSGVPRTALQTTLLIEKKR